MGKFRGKDLLWWQSFLSPWEHPKGHYKKPGVIAHPVRSRTSSNPEQNFQVSVKSVMLLNSVHNSKSNGPRMPSWFRCEMTPTGSCVWVLHPQRVVKFGEVMEHLGVLVGGSSCWEADLWCVVQPCFLFYLDVSKQLCSLLLQRWAALTTMPFHLWQTTNSNTVNRNKSFLP